MKTKTIPIFILFLIILLPFAITDRNDNVTPKILSESTVGYYQSTTCNISFLEFIFVNSNNNISMNLDGTVVGTVTPTTGKVYIFEENNSDEEKRCIIKYEKKQDKYGILEITNEKLEELKSNKLKILNMSKPLKALSSYKVLDLKEICKTLNINIMKTSTKCKTKKELYQLIQEKIN